MERDLHIGLSLDAVRLGVDLRSVFVPVVTVDRLIAEEPFEVDIQIENSRVDSLECEVYGTLLGVCALCESTTVGQGQQGH